MNIEIRKETEKDYFETEKMVRESFWNKYQPGCNEHYMVHLMRKHPVWLPKLSRIAVVDGEIAGVIMYFKAKITQTVANEKKDVEIASFEPLCVSHKFRNLGIGKKLMEFRQFLQLNTKPKVTYVYLETEFHNKGIEEDIQKTLEEMNQ